MINRKALELPFEVAQRFVRDMKAFHAEHDTLRRDKIASVTLHMMREHYRDSLRLIDIKRMFAQLHAELDQD